MRILKRVLTQSCLRASDARRILRIPWVLLTIHLTGCAAPVSPLRTVAPKPALNAAGPHAVVSARPKRYLPGARPSRDPSLPPPSKEGGYYLDDGPPIGDARDVEALPEPTPRKEALHRFANIPYRVFGKLYVPVVEQAVYAAEGRASWYGRRFHGKPTSSGEQYDMFSLTGAHRTLPIPSYVRITNVENGRHLIVRINDRGPFHVDRLMDVSYAAAYRLGFVQKGSARVRVEHLNPALERTLPTAALASAAPAGSAVKLTETGEENLRAFLGSAFLQLGSFSDRRNAEALQTRVSAFFADSGHRVQIVAHQGWHRVWLGAFASEQEARKTSAEIEQLSGVKPVLISHPLDDRPGSTLQRSSRSSSGFL